MSKITGFPPVADSDAELLILGSMPGIKSLEDNEYYAHPRNSFWYILQRIFNSAEPGNYAEKQQLLKSNKIALWDVIKSCSRKGSLDSSIEKSSIIPNDFTSFFREHMNIRKIIFNGAAAEKAYKKHVRCNSPVRDGGTGFFRLPSTSPAYASLSKEEKYNIWRRRIKP